MVNAGMRTDWNLGLLFKGDNDPSMVAERKKIEEISYNFINKWKDRNDYLQSPEVLRKALDEYENWQKVCGYGGTEGYYFMLRNEQDQDNPKLKAKNNKIDEFRRKIAKDIQFFSIRVSKIPAEEQRKFLESSSLKKYSHYLKHSFESAKYLLSEPEEKIMTLKSPSSYEKWIEMTQRFLNREEREVLLDDGKKAVRSFSEIEGLLTSSRKPVRDSAAAALNDIFRKYADVAETEMNAILADKKVDDELRKMDRPDLARHVSDDIDSKVVDVMIKSVESRFDISKRFYKLKAKLLGLKKINYFERGVPYGKQEKKYNYEEAVSLVRRAFGKLDDDFVKTLDDYVKNGNIDVYPKKGKASGAFCAGWSLIHPTFILLNYNGKIDDITTLAHELGHGINNEFMKKKQHSLYFGASTATAEVASTFIQDFVFDEIMKGADDELKLTLMIRRVEDSVATISRQVACYKFEKDLHDEFREKGYLSRQEIGKLFGKNMKNYMGSSVEFPKDSENWWVYWSHIRNFFYVYSYASGLLISKALQNKVKQDPKFIGEVKEFLSAGTSDSTRNIFANMGIDITKKEFWDSGLDEIDSLLDKTEGLAKKLGKI